VEPFWCKTQPTSWLAGSVALTRSIPTLPPWPLHTERRGEETRPSLEPCWTPCRTLSDVSDRRSAVEGPHSSWRSRGNLGFHDWSCKYHCELCEGVCAQVHTRLHGDRVVDKEGVVAWQIVQLNRMIWTRAAFETTRAVIGSCSISSTTYSVTREYGST
jgi:hypothetical protein